MEKPKCRLCGVRHWSGEPHEFKRDVKGKDARISKKVQRKAASASGPDDVSSDRLESHTGGESKKVRSDGEGGPLTQTQRNAKWRERNRERYNASQAKLMRERRAKEKSGE